MEVSLSEDEIRRLEDRRSMEAREELMRIDSMGRVSSTPSYSRQVSMI